jgi:hypothetical protein
MKLQCIGGGSDEAICLYATDGFLGLRILDKKRTFTDSLHGEQRQSTDDIPVQSKSFDFASFLLGDCNATADATILEIIDIVPTQAK